MTDFSPRNAYSGQSEVLPRSTSPRQGLERDLHACLCVCGRARSRALVCVCVCASVVRCVPSCRSRPGSLLGASVVCLSVAVLVLRALLLCLPVCRCPCVGVCALVCAVPFCVCLASRCRVVGALRSCCCPSGASSFSVAFVSACRPYWCERAFVLVRVCTGVLRVCVCVDRGEDSCADPGEDVVA